MSLIALQRDVRAWLLREDADAAARLGAAAAPGLAVHQNNYRAQLVACLEASFARTRAWIGNAAFLRAAALHIDRVPPSSWTLDAYARDLPATLAWLHSDAPEVEEIARIELALDEMFVAADSPVIGPGDFAGIDWDHAVLRIVPTLDLIDLTTNALAIWSALAAGEQPPAACDRFGVALVWRQDARCRIRAIERDELQALLALRAGAPFGELCRDAATLLGDDQGAATIGKWLGQWLADGLIAGLGQPDLPPMRSPGS